jgi:penicillin-binding protein 1A
MKNLNHEDFDFRKYVKYFWMVIFGGPILIICILLLTWAGLFGSLPSTEELANPKSYLATEIVSADGKQIGTFYTENRVFADYTEFPPHLVEALIATEDERFYNHAGIDFRGLARAIVTLGGGGGGSTITQQLAKLMFHGEGASNIFSRVIQKLKEWVISLQLESRYSKEEIISMYLNQFDFLYQAVGISNASNIYFGKSPSQLSIEESAVLVGMLRNPYQYNPVKDSKKANSLSRRNTVIRQMQRNGFITEHKADSLVSLPLVTNFQPHGHDQGLAPYLREYIRAYMKEWAERHTKPDGSNYNMYTDGLKIYTTIDSRMQIMAEDAVSKHMSNLQGHFFKQIADREAGPFYFSGGNSFEGGQKIIDKAMRQTKRYANYKALGYSEEKIVREFKTPIEMKVFAWGGDRDTTMSPWDSIQYYKSFYQAGMLSLDPQTGFIKAWVGGIDFRHFKYDAVKQGKRQVGSTFKPFVYAAAIAEKKYSPCMEVPNIQTCIEAGEYGLTRPWCPNNSNHSYGGMLTLKEAIANSVNTITTYLMKQIGPAPVIQLAKSLGITSDIPVVPSIALGTVDMSIYELAGAYTAFGNQGLYTEPLVILRIEDKNGVILEDFTSETHEVFSPEVAYTMVNLLQGITQSGTGVRLRHSGAGYGSYVTGYPYGFQNPIAGKTGTTQNNSDGWFVGMVPNLITAVWTGCQDRSAHFGSTAYGQGASTALPIWALYMRSVYTMPELGIRKDAFDAPSSPMTIELDCSAYRQQNDMESGDSEYN